VRLRISRQAHVVKARTKVKSQVHAVLIRTLRRPPVRDLFGVGGRPWLAEGELAEHERETVDACPCQIDFLDGDIAVLETRLAEAVLVSADMRRRLTLSGVNSVTAVAFIAAVGNNIERFPTAGRLVS
jgi:hypothetical protein